MNMEGNMAVHEADPAPKQEEPRIPLTKRERAEMGWPKLEPIRRIETRTGRNARCLCGSGEKFKKCCYRTAIDAPVADVIAPVSAGELTQQ